MIKSSMVSFEISAVDNSFTFEVNNAFSIPNLNASRNANNWENIKKSWEKIYEIELSAAPVGEVTILIGSDIPGAHENLEVKKPPKGMTGPRAIRTPFGWCLFGRTPDLGSHNAANSLEPIRHIRMLRQPQDNDVDSLIQKFWTLESLGIKITTNSDWSKEDKLALKRMKSTIAKVDGHYEIGLWMEQLSQIIKIWLCAGFITWNTVFKMTQKPQNGTQTSWRVSYRLAMQ